MHHSTPPRRTRLLLVRILLGLLALGIGGLALGRSMWLGDVFEGLMLPKAPPAPPEPKPGDIVRDMPGIARPVAVSADDAGLDDDTPILGIRAGGHSRAYVLEAFATGPNSHIVNDVLGGVPVSVTHCNLSGCSRAFTNDASPSRGNQPIELSAAGVKSYRLVLKTGGHAYEQETSAPLEPTSPAFPYREYHVERTSWGTWHKAHPDSDVYLGTIPPGTSIDSRPRTPTPKQKAHVEARAPRSEWGLASFHLAGSLALLLIGLAVLMPLLPRRAFRVLIVLLALVGVAVLIPGSPVSLLALFEHSGGYHEGHGTRYWLRALDSSDEQLRHEAIFALGIIGADRPEVVPALAKILAEDPDAEARHRAALSLLKIGSPARTAVPELAQALDDEEPAVRMNAALALSALGAEARPAVPALIEAIERKDNRTNLGTFFFTIQEIAVQALGQAGAGTSAGVPVLTRALKAARSTQTRQVLARALGNIGAAARPAAPQLRSLLSNKLPAVREAAAEALKRIDR
jgi:hypothetical protein